MSDFDRALADLAAVQGGAFTARQARDLGATAQMIRWRRTSGRWIDAAPGVHAVAGAPGGEDRSLWTARLSLGADALFSHETAGRLHRLSAVPPGEHAVSVGWGHHRSLPGFRVSQQHVRPIDRTVVGGLPVTTMSRTICDLATVCSTARLARIVDSAHFDRGCSYAAMGLTLLRVGTLGRPGSSKLIDVLDERGLGAEGTASQLEALLDGVLDGTALPPASKQHPLPGRGRRRGLVDRAYPEARLIVEADGRRWHGRYEAMATDRQRDLEAARAGWLTLRVMHEHLIADPDDIAAAILETYLGRLQLSA